MTTPFDIPLSFDKLAGFTPVIRALADGLRASTAAECASCAIIEYLDPADERIFGGFNAGVATMGHLLHQAWAWQAFGRGSIIEEAIPWKHGVSHDDVTVFVGPWAGVYECKTHSDPKPKAPSAANHRQAQFRMRLRELAGLKAPGPTRLVMIGKAGRESGWVRGPWEVTLTDEQRADIDDRLSIIDGMMTRAADLHLHADPVLQHNGCTTCFPKPRIESSAGLDTLVQQYGRLKAEHDEADAERAVALAAKKALAAELATLKELIEPRVPQGVVVEGITHDVTFNKNGALVITPRRDAPAA